MRAPFRSAGAARAQRGGEREGEEDHDDDAEDAGDRPLSRSRARGAGRGRRGPRLVFQLESATNVSFAKPLSSSSLPLSLTRLLTNSLGYSFY